ncbi:MAG: hypothetical protein KatS3mg071_2838 [Meiothermus sp.]|nr:MAG: hypothetical protein KatS3mg071_2838 [Meiothermus sp.]
MSSSLPDLLRTLSARGATLACVEGALVLRPKGVSAGLEESIRLWKEDLLRMVEAAGGVIGPQGLMDRVAQGASPWVATLTRDPDPSGCPIHWQRVPELPPRGSKAVMADGSGFGNLYRFKVAGAWYLLKFLPPFDGAVSLTDQQGRVRVLASLEEAARFLSLVAQANEEVIVI